jgi:ATP-dependent DNA ligase
MSIPDWIQPMAATLTQERFIGPDWRFERKLDGIRLLAFRNGAAVRLLSRTRRPQNIPALTEAIAALPVREVVLDGELTWDASVMRYHVFDLLWIDGRDVMPLSLDERRALLDRLPLRPPLARVAALGDGAPWERACAEGWEGVVAKRRDSPYEQRRSPHWLKMKCEVRQPFVIGGLPIRRAAARGWARSSWGTSTRASSCSPARSAPASTR